MRNMPIPYQLYRHFKGNLYQIMAIASHSEDQSKMVVYQALYGNYDIWVRPLEQFLSEVDHNKYPNVKQLYRFELVETAVDAIVDTGIEKIQHVAKDAKVIEQNIEVEEAIDPFLLEFLDSDTYDEKLNILVALHHRITDQMITAMAMSIDLEIKEGDLEERFLELQNCLTTRQRYEGQRLR